MDKSSLKPTVRLPPKELEVRNPNQPNNLSTGGSKCTMSRCICIQLLILLGLLVLAAIIIPIVVIVLDTRTNSTCETTYSDSFTTGVVATAQCARWRLFTTNLTCASYSKMRIYGSNDPTGITITDESVVTALAVALRYNLSSLVIPVNGVRWRVGTDWSGYEITTTGSHTCSAGYTIRPCAGNQHWGGINGITCSPLSQTLSITFE